MLTLLYYDWRVKTRLCSNHLNSRSQQKLMNGFVRDYSEHTEVEITAGVCNDLDSMTVSVLLIDNESFEQEMYHEGGCWWYSLILQEENCIEIQEIIITAQEGGSNGR